MAEHSDPDTAVRAVCVEFKRLEHRYIRDLAEAAGVSDPESVATALSLLFEGAIVTAQVSGNPRSAADAKKVAEALLGRAWANDIAAQPR